MTYQVEPYVMAADVYSQPAHLGRGGWSWYTGSAGWMYRLVVEWLLGLSLRVADAGARLEMDGITTCCWCSDLRHELAGRPTTLWPQCAGCAPQPMTAVLRLPRR